MTKIKPRQGGLFFGPVDVSMRLLELSPFNMPIHLDLPVYADWSAGDFKTLLNRELRNGEASFMVTECMYSNNIYRLRLDYPDLHFLSGLP